MEVKAPDGKKRLLLIEAQSGLEPNHRLRLSYWPEHHRLRLGYWLEHREILLQDAVAP